MERLLRRDFLAGLGLLGSSGLLVGCGLGNLEPPSSLGEESPNRSASPKPSPAQEKPPQEKPAAQLAVWKWHPLDPQEVGKKAYELYPDGSCTYSVVGGVMLVLAERFGEPYRSFPLHMA